MRVSTMERRLPIGAEVQTPDTTHFRVWAPRCETVEVALEGRSPVRLERDSDGRHEGSIRARPGDRYRLRLDGGDELPDPGSRFQPEGPFGPSMIVDASTFEWTDDDWPGIPELGRVLYEMHVGTFTP